MRLLPSALVAALALSANAATLYVSPAGHHIHPFTNWYGAATNIPAACEAAVSGDTVLLTAAVYSVRSQVLVTNGITLRGFNERESVVVDGGLLTRCFRLQHSNAAIERITITRGYTNTGAGVHLDAGAVRDCVIAGNRTHAPAFGVWGQGGGVFLGSNTLAESCVIASNFAHYGGGAYVVNGATLRSCVVEANDSQNAVSRDGVFGGLGGGVYALAGARVERCTLLTNSAQYYGGGIYVAGTGVVTRCVIRDNRVGSYASENPRVYPTGGGAQLVAGVMENCLVAGNQAGFEGGGVHAGGTSTIHSCTIAHNTSMHASVAGSDIPGGLYISLTGAVRNCILYFNTDSAANTANYNTNTASISFSCTTPPAAGTGNITNAPAFVSSATGDYHLVEGSRAIDEGSPVGAPSCDLDGTARPLDGDDDGEAAPDMGAFEFAHPQADTDGDGQTDLGEVIAGTSASDPADHFAVVARTDGGATDRHVLQWNAVTGRTYAVLMKRELGDEWEEIDGFAYLRGYNGPMGYTNGTPSGGTEFYRIRITR